MAKPTVILDQDELACRIGEAFFNSERPEGQDATESLSHLDPGMARELRNAASIASRYFVECMKNGHGIKNVTHHEISRGGLQ